MNKHRMPMSGFSIRAIQREIEQLETGKTMTRRVGKIPEAPPEDGSYFDAYNGGTYWNWWLPDGRCVLPQVKSPYGQPGDLLAFTETWAFGCEYDDVSPRNVPPEPHITRWYRADCEEHIFKGRWRPARFMPYWCSRLTGIITDVRVEREPEKYEVAV